LVALTLYIESGNLEKAIKTEQHQFRDVTVLINYRSPFSFYANEQGSGRGDHPPSTSSSFFQGNLGRNQYYLANI
jgi:hypothetical protein